MPAGSKWPFRDQIDPTIAAISTIMILVTTVLLGIAQLFGRSKQD